MARKRWEKREGQVSTRAVGEIKRIPATVSQNAQNHPPPSRSQRFTHGRAQTYRLGADGALSGSDDSGNDNRDCIVPLHSTIYVSILDPIGEPAFKPSPTKPIPTWMQWLPSQRDQGRSHETRPVSILDAHFSPPCPESATNSESETHTLCPTTPAQVLCRSSTPPLPSGFGNLESTFTTFKGHSFVSDEPLKRPSSRSPRTALGDSIAPPNPPDTLLTRSRTPYTPRQPSPLATYERKPDSGDASRKSHLHRPSSPLAEQVAAHLQRYMRRTPPAQSREFLNLYKPGPSSAVPGRWQARVTGVGDGRNALGRNRTPSPLGARVAGSRQALTDAGDVVDLRSMRKRSSLQGELKKLFGGRGQGR
ncbi:hypothetical protein GGR54DRAFT_584204 [Hypoxylon sp. NC1633]|nr:hypothetical protein GGR54DRAFT_584204 [Hypoxylon sp. NC1633]